MGDADIVMVNSQSMVTDRVSAGWVQPPADTLNNWSLVSFSNSGDSNTYVISRNLDTGDSQDKKVEVDTELRMIWSYGKEPFLFHDKYGKIGARVDSSTGLWSFQINIKDGAYDGYQIHG